MQLRSAFRAVPKPGDPPTEVRASDPLRPIDLETLFQHFSDMAVTDCVCGFENAGPSLKSRRAAAGRAQLLAKGGAYRRHAANAGTAYGSGNFR